MDLQVLATRKSGKPTFEERGWAIKILIQVNSADGMPLILIRAYSNNFYSIANTMYPFEIHSAS